MLSSIVMIILSHQGWGCFQETLKGVVAKELRGFPQMPQNVSYLISLERLQKQKHFGTSFIKIGTAVAELWAFEDSR